MTGILCCGFCRSTDSSQTEKSAAMVQEADTPGAEVPKKKKRSGGGLTGFITAGMGTSAGTAPMIGTSEIGRAHV